MGKRAQKQSSFWVETSQSQPRGRHSFYWRVNEILQRAKFDRHVEGLCRKYYAKTMGRPSLAPGIYFRRFPLGYFEGVDSERGIAHRISDSLSLREFLGLSLEEQTPDHSTLSKTRRLLSLSTHEAVFRLVLGRLAAAGLCLAIPWLGKALAQENSLLPEGEARSSRLQKSNRACRSQRLLETLSTGR